MRCLTEAEHANIQPPYNNNENKTLSKEEREACTSIYLSISDGDNSMPEHKWNKAASIELYKLLVTLKNCSEGFAWLKELPSLVPYKGLSTAVAVLKYIKKIYETKQKIEKDGKIIKICKNSHSVHHLWLIQKAAYGMGV